MELLKVVWYSAKKQFWSSKFPSLSNQTNVIYVGWLYIMYIWVIIFPWNSTAGSASVPALYQESAVCSDSSLQYRATIDTGLGRKTPGSLCLNKWKIFIGWLQKRMIEFFHHDGYQLYTRWSDYWAPVSVISLRFRAIN